MFTWGNVLIALCIVFVIWFLPRASRQRTDQEKKNLVRRKAFLALSRYRQYWMRRGNEKDEHVRLVDYVMSQQAVKPPAEQILEDLAKHPQLSWEDDDWLKEFAELYQDGHDMRNHIAEVRMGISIILATTRSTM